jgi:5-methylcytosine-specific restriction endonuclease McrA
MNRWNIPERLESEVKTRDKACIYCGVQMLDQMPAQGPRKSVATWEHIINDARIITSDNIARCCVACNSSKGAKLLADWMQSTYCKKYGISKETVSGVVRKALEIEA